MSPEDVKPEWVEKAVRARIGAQWGRELNDVEWEGVRSRVEEKWMAAALAAVLPEVTAKEPHLIEWAVEVDTIGTKEIYDTEDEARAAADKYDLRLFRIEWMEVEK